MRTDRELLKDAVDTIEAVLCTECAEPWGLIEEIRDRLAEQEEEPVAWLAVGDGKVGLRAYLHKENALDHTKNIEPLYRHPTRKPVRLSDEEVGAQWRKNKIPMLTLREYRIVANEIMDAMLEKNQ